MNIAQGVQFVSFGILAGMMIAAALGVVLLSNIVYSAFLLGLVFVSMAGLYILLNADFVGAAQVLIYVGAVNVLILFAIMLVNKREDFKPVKGRLIRQISTGLVCIGLFALLATVVIGTPWMIQPVVKGEAAIIKMGQHFFTDFLLPFELASVLLLIAMVGAIILARRDIIPESTATEISTQFTLAERPKELISTKN